LIFESIESGRVVCGFVE